MNDLRSKAPSVQSEMSLLQNEIVRLRNEKSAYTKQAHTFRIELEKRFNDLLEKVGSHHICAHFAVKMTQRVISVRSRRRTLQSTAQFVLAGDPQHCHGPRRGGGGSDSGGW